MLNSFITYCAYTGNLLRDSLPYFFKKKDEPDIPALHRFARWGNRPTVEHFIAQQVDINQTHCYDEYSHPMTVLHVLYSNNGKAEIINLVFQAGGIDSQDLKMIGHSLGLKGTIYLKGKNQNYGIPYGGMGVDDASVFIAHHIALFAKHMQQGLLGTSFNDAQIKAMHMVSEAFNLYERHKDDKFFSFATSYRQGLPIIFRCVWPDHTGFAVLYKDKLYTVNRGGNTLVPNLSCYQINANYLKSLSEVEFSILLKKLSKTRANLFSGILSLSVFYKLAPRLLYCERLSRQKNTNCSYANIKRGVAAILRALQDDSDLKWEGAIHVDSLYECFTLFDRIQSVNEYIEKYKASTNPQVWEPLLTYLRDKSGLSERSAIVSAHIIDKLSSPMIGLSMDEIKRRMHQIRPRTSNLWKLYTLLARVEDLFCEKGKRAENLKKLSHYLPGLWWLQREKVLSTCGMKTNHTKKFGLSL